MLPPCKMRLNALFSMRGFYFHQAGVDNAIRLADKCDRTFRIFYTY
jgi:hypothetical protein